jgi:hypothetical protein
MSVRDMFRNVVLVTATLASIGSAGAAEQVALWFDAENEFPCEMGSPFVPLTLHLVLLDPTFDQLHGWEAAVQSAEGEFFFMSSSVAFGGTNTGSGAAFRVEYAEPLAVGAKTVLATVTILPVSHVICLIVTGTSSPSLPVAGPIVWASADVPTEIASANILDNGVDAIIGGCGAIPEIPYTACLLTVGASPRNWGSLKAQYR